MILKRVGDSTDPWRTSLSMENGFEIAPSTWTLHVPSTYQVLMSLQVLPLSRSGAHAHVGCITSFVITSSLFLCTITLEKRLSRWLQQQLQDVCSPL